ncbi:helix-turn-helix transcriptional regulator [Clostridium magnum]|uniref:Transcriptional repressor DicA n=1 Tax=Clostridium magnum DSM 2767 TaxID=1121326 RepID=A0A161XGB5_9CLOT|nr:helix-turn-helix transcriptional regulator [Clostridium magnum]KZL93626.1 transcriptional repressor DicA [Clostridium magnum DSM 2767]SHI57220.1 Helix-turn-helix [Clostridium magnum DSM 2767]
MPQQTVSIIQNITVNFYKELYKDLDEPTVGNRIEKQRMIMNLSQRDLANVTGVSSSTIEDYESSRVSPSPNALLKMSKALRKPLECFYDDYYKFIFSDFKSIIKNWRIQNNLTLWQSGKLTGIEYRTIRKWENGKIINRTYFEKIIKYL